MCHHKKAVAIAAAFLWTTTCAAPSDYETERAERGATAVSAFERGGLLTMAAQRFYLFTFRRDISADEVLGAIRGAGGARLTALHVCPDTVGVMAFYLDGDTSREEIVELPRRAVQALKSSRGVLGVAAH